MSINQVHKVVLKDAFNTNWVLFRKVAGLALLISLPISAALTLLPTDADSKVKSEFFSHSDIKVGEAYNIKRQSLEISRDMFNLPRETFHSYHVYLNHTDDLKNMDWEKGTHIFSGESERTRITEELKDDIKIMKLFWIAVANYGSELIESQNPSNTRKVRLNDARFYFGHRVFEIMGAIRTTKASLFVQTIAVNAHESIASYYNGTKFRGVDLRAMTKNLGVPSSKSAVSGTFRKPEYCRNECEDVYDLALAALQMSKSLDDYDKLYKHFDKYLLKGDGIHNDKLGNPRATHVPTYWQAKRLLGFAK